MNREEIQALILQTVREGLEIELEQFENENYNERGFRLTVTLNGEQVAQDYIYLNGFI